MIVTLSRYYCFYAASMFVSTDKETTRNELTGVHIAPCGNGLRYTGSDGYALFTVYDESGRCEGLPEQGIIVKLDGRKRRKGSSWPAPTNSPDTYRLVLEGNAPFFEVSNFKSHPVSLVSRAYPTAETIHNLLFCDLSLDYKSAPNVLLLCVPYLERFVRVARLFKTDMLFYTGASNSVIVGYRNEGLMADHTVEAVGQLAGKKNSLADLPPIVERLQSG